ncbi:MAG: tyrosine--tRNA ligase [Anaerolineae bacterium]|nr:tyrosine--tRNA ligase [Anaerolineae bacterium]
MTLPIDEQVAILMRGVEYGDDEIRRIMEKELRERLAEGCPLRVYCGYDATKPDLHLGHTVTMRKLRQFQELGHDVTFLIGDFTTRVGDPSDKDSLRPQLTTEQIAANARTYAEQAFRILDPRRTHVGYNSEWLSKLSFSDVIKLASHFTVQQFLVRENFAKRHAQGDPIWLHEFFYALMQGYDAVAQNTDVQIGGTEQLFNLMVGRKLQEAHGQRPQVVITLPILVGTDGTIRMSKSQGNYIGISEPAETMYGKVMSIPDHAMPNYMNLVTRWAPAEIAQLEGRIVTGDLHPRDAKMMLAREIVSIFYGDEAAQTAEAHFRTVYQERELPAEMPEHRLSGPVNVVDLIAQLKLTSSKSEARRLIEKGGVRLDGKRVDSIETVVQPGGTQVLQAGRHKFVRLVS